MVRVVLEVVVVVVLVVMAAVLVVAVVKFFGGILENWPNHGKSEEQSS